MKYEIATSYADIQALLKVLDGVHRQNASERRANMITGVLFGSAMIWAAFLSWDESGEPLVAGAMALLGVGFPLALWISGRTQYVFSPHAIEKTNPLWTSWKVAVADVHHVAVEFTNELLLIITTNTGRTRQIPIVDSLSIALGTLYPELFSPSQPLHLPKRVGYRAYTILAMAILAFVVLLIVLYRRGLIEL